MVKIGLRFLSACIDLLAICLKSLMKHNNSFGNFFGKWQDKKNLLWNPLMNQFWIILETEPFVIIRVPYKRIALASHIF
jgi:hypothetical protein